MILRDNCNTIFSKPSITNFDGDEWTLQFREDGYSIEILNSFKLIAKKELKMTEQQIKKITDDVSAILLKKNADYGSASFDLGLTGNMVHLWDKVRRYRSLVENKDKTPNFESVEDTLKDIIGYAIIGLIILGTENNGK